MLLGPLKSQYQLNFAIFCIQLEALAAQNQERQVHLSQCEAHVFQSQCYQLCSLASIFEGTGQITLRLDAVSYFLSL